MKTTVNNLVTLEVGVGNPVVFLHGYLSSKESFTYQINYLKNYFKIYAPDLSGFGESPPLSCAYSLDDYVLEVINFVDALGLKKYDIIAHSFGGRIAIKLSKIDKRVNKIVLTGCAGLKPKRSPLYYLKVYTYKVLKKILPKNKLKNFGSKEYKSLSEIQKQSFVKIVNEHLDDLLKYVDNKTLIIFGNKDKATPIYMAKKLNKNIKNSSLVILKDCSHFAFVDKPREFNLLVKEFLLGD